MTYSIFNRRVVYAVIAIIVVGLLASLYSSPWITRVQAALGCSSTITIPFEGGTIALGDTIPSTTIVCALTDADLTATAVAQTQVAETQVAQTQVAETQAAQTAETQAAQTQTAEDAQVRASATAEALSGSEPES